MDPRAAGLFEPNIPSEQKLPSGTYRAWQEMMREAREAAKAQRPTSPLARIAAKQKSLGVTKPQQ